MEKLAKVIPGGAGANAVRPLIIGPTGGPTVRFPELLLPAERAPFLLTLLLLLTIGLGVRAVVVNFRMRRSA
jgi:hypothetical protein